MAVGQEIVDRYVGRRAELVRYETRVVRDVLAILQRGEDQAIGAITTAYGDYLESTGGLPIPWDGKGVATRRRILNRVRAALSDVFPEAERSLRAALEQVAIDETTAFVNTLNDVMPKPIFDELELSSVPDSQIANIVDDAFGERFKDEAGKWIGSSGKSLGAIEGDTLTRVNQIVTDGLRDGTGTRQLIGRARRALGAKKGTPLYNDVTRYIRTAIQTTANDVAAQLYQSNADVVAGEQYVAALDDDTCPVCGPLDGTTYYFDKGQKVPRPPLHPNCRCFVAPVMRRWDDMGLKSEPSAGFKALFDGKAAPRTRWSEWKERNPGPRSVSPFARGARQAVAS